MKIELSPSRCVWLIHPPPMWLLCIRCANRTYKKSTTRVSVIINYHNELLSLILRSIYTVLLSIPEENLEELILIDDASNLTSHCKSRSYRYQFGDLVWYGLRKSLYAEISICGGDWIETVRKVSDVFFVSEWRLKLFLHWLPVGPYSFSFIAYPCPSTTSFLVS